MRDDRGYGFVSRTERNVMAKDARARRVFLIHGLGYLPSVFAASTRYLQTDGGEHLVVITREQECRSVPAMEAES
jgi:hypothetical protein